MQYVSPLVGVLFIGFAVCSLVIFLGYCLDRWYIYLFGKPKRRRVNDANGAIVEPGGVLQQSQGDIVNIPRRKSRKAH
jgi:hypothetical protein